jgi:hypothetical protein
MINSQLSSKIIDSHLAERELCKLGSDATATHHLKRKAEPNICLQFLSVVGVGGFHQMYTTISLSVLDVTCM